MKLSNRSHFALALWLPLALVTTLISGASLWAVQQNYRTNADDPQIQIANDSIQDLAEVPDLSQLANAFGKADAAKTLAPFMIIYDDSGKAIAGNGYINDQLPTPPSGTFNEARKKSVDRFTWQPQKNLRFAAVLKPFSGQQKGFVLSARSLLEVEKREKMLYLGAGAAWLAALALSFLWCLHLAKWLNAHFARHDHAH